MGVVFPLSWGGKVVLFIIAILLGCIWWMMVKPEHWEWLFSRVRKNGKAKQVQEKDEKGK